MKDYYYILGVEPKSSQAEIKTAYRKLSVKFHPDKNQDEKYFERQFKEIQEAYETLSSPTRKRNYDWKLSQYKAGAKPGSYSGHSESEIKARYEREFKRKEEELKKEYEKKSNSEEQPEKQKSNRDTETKKTPENMKLVYTGLAFMGLILVFLCYYWGSIQFLKPAPANKVRDSTKNTQGLESEHKEKQGSAKEPKSLDEDSIYVPFDQLKAYYENGKNDQDIRMIRSVLDEYQNGLLDSSDQIDPEVIDSLSLYGPIYAKGNFMIASAKQGLSGNIIHIMFLHKPDKAFEIWALHNRIVYFKDANWNEELLRKIRLAKQMFYQEYSF